ncbi:MAG: DNA-methyltransferase [Acidiferrobacteraceae bacterium]
MQRRIATPVFNTPLPSVDIRHGDVLDRLAEMSDESVHCVITSPPYWGLRDYGLEPVLWRPVRYAPMPGMPLISIPDHGGTHRFEHCTHEWDDWSEQHDVREAITHGKTRTTERSSVGDASRRFDGNHQKHRHGQFCHHCGAWRGCFGLEPTPSLYIGHLIQIFQALRRVLRNDGTAWLNLGDSYTSSGKGGNHGDSPYQKQSRNRGTVRNTPKVDLGIGRKQMVGLPWQAAFALQADGWWLRSDIVWQKPNAMPESIRDRPTRAHEMIFLLAKSERYFYDHLAVREPSTINRTRKGTAYVRDEPGADSPDDQRNLRDVWTISTCPFKGPHFATFPPDLVKPMILAATSEHGVCTHCGAPYERTITRETTENQSEIYHGSSFLRGKTREAREHLRPVGTGPRTTRITTIGWHPTCACPAPADPVPATVLDPFFGAGTTGLMARHLGRSCIGIEAGAHHVALAHTRLNAGDPPLE